MGFFKVIETIRRHLYIYFLGAVAQCLEHKTLDQEDQGSNLLAAI